MEHYLSIVACFRDEACYLKEWIDFHKGVGVEHFYLYENHSSDNFLEILTPYLDEGSVTLITWDPMPGQMPAYQNAIHKFGKFNNWMAFIDIDEFLYCPYILDIRQIIKRYEQETALVVNWVNFGSSGLIAPPDELVTHAYTNRGEIDVVVPYPHLLRHPSLDKSIPSNYRPLNTHVKSIVHPWKVAHCLNPHFFIFNSGTAVSEQGTPVEGPWSEVVSIEHIRLNHYWSKSETEMKEKIERGRADGGALRTMNEFYWRDKNLNSIVDVSAKETYKKACDKAKSHDCHLNKSIFKASEFKQPN